MGSPECEAEGCLCLFCYLITCVGYIRSRESSVYIATGYGLDGPGSLPGGQDISPLHSLLIGSGAQIIQWLPGTLSPGGTAAGA
jgi:hypothetical protein